MFDLYSKLKETVIFKKGCKKSKNQDYLYQLKDENLSFDQAVEILRTRIENKIELGGINNQSQENIESVLDQLSNLNITVKELEIDNTEYNAYIRKAEYKNRYPTYYSDNFDEKSFEHFLCHKFLGLEAGQIFVDLASEHSPVPKIFNRLSGCDSYSQDIMYPEGINGKRIGGDASNMPVEDSFFDAAIATCSIEHFENQSDVLLMKEMGRTLKRHGKFIIVPLYLYSEAACQTDPVYAVPSGVQFDREATVFCCKNWGNRHGRFYSPQTLMDRLIRSNPDISFIVYYIKNPEAISKSIYCRYMLVGEKLN